MDGTCTKREACVRRLQSTGLHTYQQAIYVSRWSAPSCGLLLLARVGNGSLPHARCWGRWYARLGMSMSMSMSMVHG